MSRALAARTLATVRQLLRITRDPVARGRLRRLEARLMARINGITNGITNG